MKDTIFNKCNDGNIMSTIHHSTNVYNRTDIKSILFNIADSYSQPLVSTGQETHINLSFFDNSLDEIHQENSDNIGNRWDM